MNHDTVMLLIDADNVSIDVVEQAIGWVRKHYGGPHVRRAYCTAESAVKHQAAFKRLGVRPMVNLAAGKNSTDIALAVDAIDLVVAERPEVVVIASSDSDFAPLVSRLREKGCRVVGLGQDGKVGDETVGVYDDFEVFAHRRPARPHPAPAAAERAPGGRGAARKSSRGGRAGKGGNTSAAAPASPPAANALVTAAPARAEAGDADLAAGVAVPDAEVMPPVEVAAVVESPAAPAESAAAAPAAAPAAKKRTSRRKPKAAASEVATAPPEPAEPAAPPAPPLPDKARQILEALPALARGEVVELRVAAEKLREAGLLSKSGSSTKLFGQFADLFELQPPAQPNRVKGLPRAAG